MIKQWQLLEAGYCKHPEITSRRGGSWRVQEFPALVGLIQHPQHGWILFDTGYGQAFADATRELPESMYRWITPITWTPQQSVTFQLKAQGLCASDISHILVSHFHGDHVGGLPEFQTAKIWCARPAWMDLHSRSRLNALSKGLLPALAPASLAKRMRFYERTPAVQLPDELAPFVEGYDLFGDGSFFAVALPGHAPGHFGVCFQTRRGWVFLVADAAWSTISIMDNCPPPRWATGLLGDTVAYRRTLANLHALACRRGNVLLVPSHCTAFRP
jgi:glyoxylase-like metal-dependent hydrolase (beta-lactamase superfamily II)